MFNLTREEQKVFLFLFTVALIGLGINFAVKINSRIERFIKIDNNFAKMEINKASLQDLSDAKYMSRLLAERIIEYRNTHGLFKNLEDLKEVKGIGDYRYEKLKDLFFVE